MKSTQRERCRLPLNARAEVIPVTDLVDPDQVYQIPRQDLDRYLKE